MKVYITKYALTKGIIETEVLARAQGIVSDLNFNYYHKPDWHKTKEEAIDRAKIMPRRRILSLQDQIIKLEAMKF